MSRAKGRRERCGRAQARQRLGQARSYLLVSELVISAEDLAAWTNVVAGTAVLAAVAAADAICCATIGERWRGQDHERAADLLEAAVPDGKALAGALRKVLAVKDQSHYGFTFVTPAKARAAFRGAGRLIERATAELER